MMAKGCVRSEEFNNFLVSLRGENASQFTDDKVMEAVANLNAKLKRFNMMIRYTLDDKTHERFYSLISTVDNDITRQATHHSEKEFEYFRTIFEELQDGPKPIDHVLTLCENLAIKNVKSLVSEWCEKHWLVEERDGNIRLGPRARAELDVLMNPQGGNISLQIQ